MILFILFIASLFFDPNIGIANSISRVLFFIILIITLIKTRGKIKISKLMIIQAITAIGLLISVAINDGSMRDLILVIEQLLIYFAAYNYLDSKTNNNKIMKAIGAIGTALAIIGIMEFIFSPNLEPILSIFRTIKIGQYTEGGVNRISSTFINPIYFSTILVISLFSLQGLCYEKKKWYYVISWLICLVALLLTKSEGGIISFILIESLYGIRKIRTIIAKYSTLWKIIAAAVTVIIVAVIAYQGIGQNTLVKIFTKRVYAWDTSINIFNNNPMIGAGLGNFDKQFRVYGNKYISNYYFEEYAPHSDLFGIMANGGIIALIPFIYMLIYEIKISNTLSINAGNKRKVYLIEKVAVMIILYFTLHRIIDDFYINYRVITLINIIMAITERIYDDKRKTGLINKVHAEQ